MTELEEAILSLQQTCDHFNKHMEQQMLVNIEIKKKLAENRKALEELLHAQQEDNRGTETNG